jgi:hypothetical protein
VQTRARRRTVDDTVHAESVRESTHLPHSRSTTYGAPDAAITGRHRHVDTGFGLAS